MAIRSMSCSFHGVYPPVKFFVQKAVYNEIQSSKKNFNNDVESFYAKIKALLSYNPELRSRIDKLYGSEIKKIKNKGKKIYIEKL